MASKISSPLPTSSRQRQILFARLAAERFKRSQASKLGYERSLAKKIKKAEAELQEIQADVKLEEVQAEIEKNRRKRVEEAKEKYRETQRRIERARAERKPLVGRVEIQEVVERQREEIMESRALSSAKKEIEIQEAGGYSRQRAEDAQKIQREVVLGREMMEERLDQFYRKQLAEGKVQKIKRNRRPGYTYRREGPVHQGLISSRFRGKIVDAELREEVAAEASRVAERLLGRVPGGKLYATFSFYEYGRGRPKSSHETGSDTLGTYWQSFDSVGSRFGVQTESVDDFESRVRELLLEHATEQNALVLDSFEIKAFREKSKEETRDWNRRVRLRRKAKEEGEES